MPVLWEGLKFFPCIIAELQQKVVFSFHELQRHLKLGDSDDTCMVLRLMGNVRFDEFEAVEQVLV